MVTRNSEDFVVEGTVVFKPDAAIDRNQLLRQLVTSLGSFEGEEFAPRGERSASFMNGEGSARRVVLAHPAYTEATGNAESWLSVSLDIEKARGLFFLTAHMGQPEQQLDLGWNMGLEIMPRLMSVVTPRSAFLNGRLVDRESSEFPSEQPLLEFGLPKMFTPWTFFDDDKLDTQMREKLSALPVVFSGPIASGWAVQAVKTLRDPPSPEFIAALKTLVSKPITYIGPMLDLED